MFDKRCGFDEDFGLLIDVDLNFKKHLEIIDARAR